MTLGSGFSVVEIVDVFSVVVTLVDEDLSSSTPAVCTLSSLDVTVSSGVGV